MKVKDIFDIIEQILTSIDNLVNGFKKLFKKLKKPHKKNINIQYI